jgi:hypothetical protein
MRKILLSLILLQAFVCFSQKKLDSKIILTVADSTTGLYEKAKMALLYQDLSVTENPSKDTLTAVQRYFTPVGFIVTKVAVSGNKLIFWGIFGLVRITDWNYPKIPRDYNKIMYYKSSKTWKFMLDRAKRMYMGELSYEK